MTASDKASSRKRPKVDVRLALVYPDGSIGVLAPGAAYSEAKATQRFANAGKAVDQQAHVVRLRLEILGGAAS